MNAFAGVSSPTIEGKIILTAENNMAAGFASASKDLKKFADEFNKTQAQINAVLNAGQKQQLKAARDQTREAGRVNNLVTGMFTQFVTAATSAFTALEVMGSKYEKIYQDNAQAALRLSIQMSANSKILVDDLKKDMDELAKRLNVSSRSRLYAVAGEVAARTDDRAAVKKRVEMVYDIATTISKIGAPTSAEEVQNRIQTGVMGRPLTLIKLLADYYPDFFKRHDRENMERNIQDISQGPGGQERIENFFFSQIALAQQEGKGLKGAAEAAGEIAGEGNKLARSMENLDEYFGNYVHPKMQAFYKILSESIDAFLALPKDVKDLLTAMAGLVIAFGAAKTAMWALSKINNLGGGPRVGGPSGGPWAPGQGPGKGAKPPGGVGMKGGWAGWLTLLQYQDAAAGAEQIRQRKSGELKGIPSPSEYFNIFSTDWSNPWGNVKSDAATATPPDAAMMARAADMARARRAMSGDALWQLPGRATGGPVSAGTPYTVGEGGREMFIPQGDGSIAPMRGGMGAGMGQSRVKLMQFNQSLSGATAEAEHFGGSLEQVAAVLQKMWLDLTAGGGGAGGGDGSGYGGGEGGGGEDRSSRFRPPLSRGEQVAAADAAAASPGGGGRARAGVNAPGGPAGTGPNGEQAGVGAPGWQQTGVGASGGLNTGGGTGFGQYGKPGSEYLKNTAAAGAGPGGEGQYRPQYKLTEGDLSDDTMKYIIYESNRTGESRQAVIDNLMNRVGSGRGRESVRSTLYQKGQYEATWSARGKRMPPQAELDATRQALRDTAAGKNPSLIGSSTSYRAMSYMHGKGEGKTAYRAWQRQGGHNVGGNAYFSDQASGPYSPYETPHQPASGSGSAVVLPAATASGAPARNMSMSQQLAAQSRARSMARSKAPPPSLLGSGTAWPRDPLNAGLSPQNTMQLGRGQVDVNLKLDRQLAATRPSTMPASNFDLGVNVDRTGTVNPNKAFEYPAPAPFGGTS